MGGEVLRGVLAVLARAARAVRDGSVTYFYLTDVARPAKRAPCFPSPADRVNLEKTWETTRTERQAKRIHERIACRTSLFDADPGLSSLFEKAMEPMLQLPGPGLAGVWAEENSRDALFDAMERREVFGTSGPRMTARFFGGWAYPEALCGDAQWLEKSYQGGVAMGGDLPPRPAQAKAPVFVVQAQRDPGIPEHPGGLLQRAQVVKGWVGDDGLLHEKVYDVAGGADEASVDLDTCQVRGPGADTLCATWRDPDFDASRDAVYYVRVLENPSCRWSQRQCISLPEAERPESCRRSVVPRTIQERLWTSPIWYEAPAANKAQAS